MIDVSKANLSVPTSSSIVKGSKLINKVWFQNIKPKLYLMKPLDMSPPSEQTHFNFIYALGALRSSMAYQPAFGTFLMNTFISTLIPGSSAIIQP